MSRLIVLTTLGSYCDIHPSIANSLGLRAWEVDAILELDAGTDSRLAAFNPQRP